MMAVDKCLLNSKIPPIPDQTPPTPCMHSSINKRFAHLGISGPPRNDIHRSLTSRSYMKSIPIRHYIMCHAFTKPRHHSCCSPC